MLIVWAFHAADKTGTYVTNSLDIGCHFQIYKVYDLVCIIVSVTMAVRGWEVERRQNTTLTWRMPSSDSAPEISALSCMRPVVAVEGSAREDYCHRNLFSKA